MPGECEQKSGLGRARPVSTKPRFWSTRWRGRPGRSKLRELVAALLQVSCCVSTSVADSGYRWLAPPDVLVGVPPPRAQPPTGRTRRRQRGANRYCRTRSAAVRRPTRLRNHQRGGAPDLLQELAPRFLGEGFKFPPMDDPPPGRIVRISVERVTGAGPWA